MLYAGKIFADFILNKFWSRFRMTWVFEEPISATIATECEIEYRLINENGFSELILTDAKLCFLISI